MTAPVETETIDNDTSVVILTEALRIFEHATHDLQRTARTAASWGLDPASAVKARASVLAGLIRRDT